MTRYCCAACGLRFTPGAVDDQSTCPRCRGELFEATTRALMGYRLYDRRNERAWVVDFVSRPQDPGAPLDAG